MTTTASDNRGFVIKFALLVLFLFGFLTTAGYTLIKYADEGPSVRWVPPAYAPRH